MNRSFKNKMKSDQLCFSRITNNDLVCKDCLYRFEDSEILGNTSRCEMYALKEAKVLSGGKCDLYDHEDDDQ